jgi:hypothetical protein
VGWPVTDHQFIGTGMTQEATPGRQEHAREMLDNAVAYATKSHTHLWIVLLTYRATDGFLDHQDGTDPNPALLDVDLLLGVPGIGCYICETTYRPAERRRRCTGTPKRSRL